MLNIKKSCSTQTLHQLERGMDASVQRMVRELRQMGFYDFYADPPFILLYVLGQGFRLKELGVKKYRRTSNFSSPHKTVYDKAGRRVVVVAINDASKSYLKPEWLSDPKDYAVAETVGQQAVHSPALVR